MPVDVPLTTSEYVPGGVPCSKRGAGLELPPPPQAIDTGRIKAAAPIRSTFLNDVTRLRAAKNIDSVHRASPPAIFSPVLTEVAAFEYVCGVVCKVTETFEEFTPSTLTSGDPFGGPQCARSGP
jgi:hypothetical protein